MADKVGSALPISDCQIAIGYVVFDVMCLTIGAVGLRAGVQRATIEAIGAAIQPSMSAIEKWIAVIGRRGVSTKDQAIAVFNILRALNTGSTLGAVFAAFRGSLTWWNMILYGVTGLATILAVLATDGVALVAEIVILLTTFGFLVSDSVNAVQTCGLAFSDEELTELTRQAIAMEHKGPSLPYEPTAAIMTVNSNYLAVVDNGGMKPGKDLAIATNSTKVGHWEVFTFVPLDPALGTFALKTSKGYYVTAVKGGGVEGHGAINTNSRQIGHWETITFEMQGDDKTFALRTSSGYYLTAVDGGGLCHGALITNSPQVGSHETFTLVPIYTHLAKSG